MEYAFQYIADVPDGHTHIIDVVEIRNIVKTVNPVTGTVGVQADGVVLDPESYVSMNMWGFPAKLGCDPAFMKILEKEFVTFLRQKWRRIL